MVYLAVLVYTLVFPLGFLLYSPFYLRKLIKRGNWRSGFFERVGLYSMAKQRAITALKRPVWIHAVSVGETVAALSFIRAWQQREPDRGFVLTTTTSTGQQIARDKAPANVVPLYFPLDWCPVVCLAMRAIRPTLLVIFEKEFWPTLMFTARKQGIPMVLANGMLSDRSWKRYAAKAWLFGPIFRCFDRLCVQTETDAERVRAIAGQIPQVHVCNTMKFDAAPDASLTKSRDLVDPLFPDPDRVVWCAASTHPGEEAMVLDIFQRLRADFPALRLLLAPRHSERVEGEVVPLLAATPLVWRRRTALSSGKAAPVPAAGLDVLVVDTTGELMSFLAVSDLVYVGKTLAGNSGGHNVIEPAIFGKAIVTGTATENFRPVMDAFRAEQGCLEVEDAAGLEAALRGLLEDPQARADLGRRALETVAHRRGAIAHTLDLIAEVDATLSATRKVVSRS